ncbi:hypothetical protein AB6A40_000417 [Gnathostoma spinigerum]|uniref:AB hydrolase-1 domain-containing protein n=1 Tax=Gnathostoma spinigerum TaxID=75299 RepID=A0ABD6EAE3_9BILA
MPGCQYCNPVCNVVRLMGIWSLSAFWSIWTILKLIVEWWKNKETFFVVKEHPKPDVLKGWKEGFAQLSEDIKLHYIEDGDKSKPLMLFVHGFPEFWYSWRFQLRHFREKYHVVAIDMRGYGESSKPTAVSNYDSALLAKDVKECIEALGYQKAIVVAHDWGAAIAWKLATDFPEVIDRLVILNVGHPKAFAECLRKMPSQLLKSWYMFMFQMPLLPEFRMRINDFSMLSEMLRSDYSGIKKKENFTDEDLEAWKYTFSQKGAFTGPINYYRHAMQHLPPTDSPVPMVKPKTLIIWGTADIALDKAMAGMSLQYCEMGQLRYVDGASHWVQQDEPEKVNEFIENFLMEN